MITFNALDQHQIIVPVRFDRAIRGFSLSDAPEVDDRGWIMGTATSGWSTTNCRGPMVGMMVAKTVRIKLVREDIDDSAPLYISAETPDIIEVIEPAENVALGEDGIFRIRGTTSRGAPGKVFVRLGRQDGPIIGELEPHVFGRLRIPIQVHRVRIDSAATTGTRPNQPIERMVRRMRAIWRPCGIDIVFNPRTRPIIDDNITLAVADQVRFSGPNVWNEVKQVLRLQRNRLGLAAGTKDQAINWYIIDDFDDGSTVGVGIHPRLASRLSTDPGIFTTANGVTDDVNIERAARTVAHEIGHFFTLKHVQERNADNPVKDTYGRKQLMYPISWLTGATSPRSLTRTPRFNNVGYTNPARGCLLTMKNHNHHSTDGECGIARVQIRSGNWF